MADRKCFTLASRFLQNRSSGLHAPFGLQKPSRSFTRLHETDKTAAQRFTQRPRPITGQGFTFSTVSIDTGKRSPDRPSRNQIHT